MITTLSLANVLHLALQAGTPAAPPPALRGLDPVQLCAGTEVAGDPELAHTHGRYTYVFEDEASRARFLADPERFAIQWGGGCGRMGPLSGTGSPDRFAVHAGRIFVFASDGCRAGFLATPERFVVEPTTLPAATPEARAAGAAWLERAVEAHGGSAALDAAAALLLAFDAEQSGWKHHSELVLGRAGGLRQSSRWTAPDAGAEPRVTTWLVAREASLDDDGEQFAVTSPDQLDDLRRIAQREPLAHFWARAQPGFVALHLGAGELGGAPVENVLVQHAGLTTTLHLEPESARVLGLSWRGRASDGVTREIVETFTDWRELDGVLLPIARMVRADGAEKPSLAVAWQSLAFLPAFPASR